MLKLNNVCTARDKLYKYVITLDSQKENQNMKSFIKFSGENLNSYNRAIIQKRRQCNNKSYKEKNNTIELKLRRQEGKNLVNHTKASLV